MENDNSRQNMEGEIKNKAKDGSATGSTLQLHLYRQGRPYQYVATKFDITERKKQK
jgi:PAS domain-containing protein